MIRNPFHIMTNIRFEYATAEIVTQIYINVPIYIRRKYKEDIWFYYQEQFMQTQDSYTNTTILISICVDNWNYFIWLEGM